MVDKLPVEFVDAEDGKLLGWIAMPVVPVAGDAVQLPGMYLAHVMSRRWENKHPGETASMREAGIDPAWTQWVAVVALGDWERDDEDGDGGDDA